METWLYENNKENTVRYVLGTKGSRPLICFGINPSTAEPGKLDNTLKSVERLAANNGYDSWIMLNIYPQRATDPGNLHQEKDKMIHENNLAAINRLFGKYKDLQVWAAWGNNILRRPFLKDCLKDIYLATKVHGIDWVRIGNLSKAGHPRHPLYVKADTPLETFNMQGYFLESENL